MKETLGIGEQVAVTVTRHTNYVPYLVLALAVIAGIYVYLLIKQRRDNNGTEISDT